MPRGTGRGEGKEGNRKKEKLETKLFQMGRRKKFEGREGELKKKSQDVGTLCRYKFPKMNMSTMYVKYVLKIQF